MPNKMYGAGKKMTGGKKGGLIKSPAAMVKKGK